MKRRQIISLVFVAWIFVAFDLGLYLGLTRRLGNQFGTFYRTQAIDPADYLPFSDDSLLPPVEAGHTLTGELPVLDGAAALFPVYAGVFQALYPQQSLGWDGDAFTAGSKLQYRNTKQAFLAVADGRADLIFCAAPSQAQLEAAKELGAELELVPIGKEAFVFVVNEKNPMSDLTSDQIRAIYGGRITNWSQVGGPEIRINALQRDPGSGSQTALVSFMGDVPLMKPKYHLLAGSIGCSFRCYAEGITKTPGIKLLCVDGIYPGEAEIQSGSYPLCSYFYAIYRRDNENENVQRILDWILSPDGQALIRSCGYTPLEEEGR